MTEELLERCRLENGLELFLYDASRRVAGDRWQVVLIVRAEVPVVASLLALPDGKSGDDIRSVLGDSLVWEQRRERNFIDEKEKKAVFEAMVRRFNDNTRGYLAHPDFAAKFIARRYDDLAKKRR
ncbi:MAG: hypothetical protein ACLFS7_07550 [Desulfosudaceae bacterium]